eukprot:5179640-Alexandrium_andersonii.AAC.1
MGGRGRTHPMAPAPPGQRDGAPPKAGPGRELQHQRLHRDRPPLVLDRGGEHHPGTIGGGLQPPVQ